MTNLTLQLTDEQQALLDQVRGEQDLASFVLESSLNMAAALAKAELDEELGYPAALEDNLTTANHRRLAAAARTNYLEVDDFEREVWTAIEAQRAARHTGQVQ